MQRIYIHQDKKWPRFTFDHIGLQPLLGEVRNLQGRLTGYMEAMGFSLREACKMREKNLRIPTPVALRSSGNSEQPV